MKAGIALICSLLCLVSALEPVMAETDPTQEKFALIQAENAETHFDLDGELLDFTTASPDGFLWNDSAEIPTEFVPAALFSAFEQVRIGYHPLSRDRYEVRIYRADVYPDRIALAADYASLMARAWGPKNFGVAAHSPVFGEVLGGNDSSGVMMINRISVIRRDDSLLIVRQRFDSSRFSEYGADMARLVGSIQFDLPNDSRLIPEDANTTALPAGASPDFVGNFPSHWAQLGQRANQGPRGTYEFWADATDAKGNLGAMLASVPTPGDWQGPPSEPPELGAFGDTAGGLANLALENLVPGQPFQLEPVEATRFSDLAEVTAFNGLYTFRVKLGEDQVLTKLNVLLTYGMDGHLLAGAFLSPAGQDLYLAGTDMHGTYVQAMHLESLRRHYGIPTSP